MYRTREDECMKAKTYVPVMSGLFKKYREEYAEAFKKIGEISPVLCMERSFDSEKNDRNLEILKDNIQYLIKMSYKPFVWAQAFGFGIPLDEKEAEFAKGFERITDFEGRKLGDAMCPLDEEFLKYYKSLIQGIAKAGAKRIMLDDDLCLSVRPGLGCLCKKHQALLNEKLGYPIDGKTLRKELFKGEGSELRRVWLEVMGGTLIDFCRKVRKFADEINPEIEMGFCAGYTSWDIEGVDAISLTKILAGKNKPFMRLTGAPYWVEQRRFDGQGMAQIVEFTRMQRAWGEKSGVEIFTENDSYPRPRYRVPAAILETFDFCMAADSDIGQLKYLFEYYSSPKHETGYVNHHLRNREKRNTVQSIMADLHFVGIYVHEQMRKVSRMSFPENAMSDYETMMTAFSHAADMLSSCTIPTTYEKHGGVVAAFGDSGRTVDLDNKGYIIDYPAAIVLTKRGVDVGLISAKGTDVPFTEKFIDEQDEVLLDDCIRSGRQKNKDVFFSCEIRKEAFIESAFLMTNEEIPASYRYENHDGQKFLVFLFDASALKPNSGLSCSYYRRKQILKAAEWMGEKLPVIIKDQPGMYAIVKEDEEKTAIAFANFSLDPAYDVMIETNKRGRKAEFIGAEGELMENGVRVSIIQPWATGCVVIHK